ncbi:DUF418 domain-containing protein [Streptomyces chartreusis]|uniref:DUF418 domain-containing protein n=1 Tax=Streptomyces chartreusis TaxID=1969 RepID=UPI00368B8897
MVNAQTMSGGPPNGQSTAGEITNALISVIFAGKFYFLFAFLFGYSFTLQAPFTKSAGIIISARHSRRLLGLLLIGFLHAVLLYPGDILTTYAVLGLALVPARGRSARTLCLIAGLLIVALSLLLLVAGSMIASNSHPAASHVAGHLMEAEAYRSDPLAVVRTHLSELPRMITGSLIMAPHVLAAMLLGLAAGSRKTLAQPWMSSQVLARIARWGLALGLTGSVTMTFCQLPPFAERWWLIGTAVEVLTAPALTAAYACGVLLVTRSYLGRRTAAVLASAGRLALTNYLSQSLVMAIVFTGYGLALYGSVTTAMLSLGCLALYLAQLGISLRWTRSHRYGPAEWLLRFLTGPASQAGNASEAVGASRRLPVDGMV